MTSKELYKYIKSLNKKIGTYSEEDLYDIGLKHRSLARNEKDWTKLSKFLGLDKTGDAYRCWVRDRLKGEGMLPKDKTKISARTIDDLTFEEASAELTKQKQDLFIQQVKTRDERAAYLRTLRDEARIESLKSCIIDSIANLNSLPVVHTTTNSKNLTTEAVLAISDLHIGTYCDNFYNKYDINIAASRLNLLVDKAIEYCRLHKVKRLNILNLGDLIQGNIHINARIEQCASVIDQVMIASELLAQAINKLQAAAPEVIYRSVTDNHSRITPNKEEHIEKENLNRLIDWYVISRLANTKVKFVNETDKLDLSFDRFKLLNGSTVMFSHGHTNNKNTLMQDSIGALREWVDYIFVAHFHSAASKMFQGCKVFINGSIVGTEDYALSKKLFSKPSQKLVIFNNTKDVVDIDINLEV